MKSTLAITDEQLITSYKSGDNNSIGILYHRYSKKVFHKCISFLKDEDKAYDVSQDILLKSFEKINSFKGNSSFSTWLFSITTNHCIEFLRKERKYIFTSINDGLDIEFEETDYSEAILLNNKEETMKKILEEIPIEDKEILLMKYEKNASIKDLQLQFNLSASAMKMRLMRARQRTLNSFENKLQSIAC